MNDYLSELQNRESKMTPQESHGKEKLLKIFQEMVDFIETNADKIKSSNLFMSNIKTRDKNKNGKDGDLNEPLLSSQEQEDVIAVEDVLNQHDEVQRRHQDVQEIHGKSKNIKEFTEQTLNVIVSNDLDLENIQKKNMVHEDRVKKDINPEILKTKGIMDKLTKRGFCIAGIVAILVVLLSLLLFVVLKK